MVPTDGHSKTLNTAPKAQRIMTVAITHQALTDRSILELLEKIPAFVDAAKTPEAHTALLQQAARLRDSLGKGKRRRKSEAKRYHKVPDSAFG